MDEAVEFHFDSDHLILVKLLRRAFDYVNV